MVVKAEIHCHIEGAASTSLVASQARKYGVNIDGLIKGDSFVWTDFTTFLKAFDKAAAGVEFYVGETLLLARAWPGNFDALNSRGVT